MPLSWRKYSNACVVVQIMLQIEPALAASRVALKLKFALKRAAENSAALFANEADFAELPTKIASLARRPNASQCFHFWGFGLADDCLSRSIFARAGDRVGSAMGRLSVLAVVLMFAACTPVNAPAASSSPASKSALPDAGCQNEASSDTSCVNAANDKRSSQLGTGKSPASDASVTGAAQRGAAGKDAPSQRGGEPASDAAGSAASAAVGSGGMQAGVGGSGIDTDMRLQGQNAMAGGGGSGADPAMSSTAMAPNTPVSDMLVRPAESECEYMEVRARNDAAGAPYQVPTGDVMQCFLIDLGFEAPTQALEFKAIVEHPELVKHMVLRTWGRSDVRGPLISCSEGNETYDMVAVWAPGIDDWYYPADMGIDLGRGLFTLEVHYVNNGAASVQDQSGMRICTTKKLRPRTASMSWLGNQVFVVPGGVRDYPVSGRCTPQNQKEPIHILRVATYMNALGKRATMQLDRIDGSTEVMFDEMRMPGLNISHDTPATVRVGDTLLSTCYYDNPSPSTVSVGVRNGSELCHFFALAYPAYTLVSDEIQIEHNSCLGSP